jgi:F0F1-type ATP synthase membrane subunit b/b'
MVSAAITAGQLIPLLAAFIAFVGVMVTIIVGLVKSLIAASNRSIDSARESIEKRLDQQSADIRELRTRVATRDDGFAAEVKTLSEDYRGLAVRVQHLER